MDVFLAKIDNIFLCHIMTFLFLSVFKIMGELVVKNNALVSASYHLDLVEQRLILLAIVEARQTGQGIDANDALTVHAESYVTQFGVHRNTAYEALKNACNNLFSRQFSYQKLNSRGNLEIHKSRWVSEVAYIENEATVKLIFAPAIVPMITKLEEQFTKYDIEQVSHLNSAYSVRLYELLIQWRTVGRTPVFVLSDFREQLGVFPNEYALIADFKRRVLDLAVNQINTHTDLTVRYEQHKSGRTIIGFSFEFKIAPRPDHLEAKLVKPDKAAAKRKVIDALSDYWDRLHGLELVECQKINPALCRADIETMAKALNISALQAMQQIRAQAKTQATTKQRQKGSI